MTILINIGKEMRFLNSCVNPMSRYGNSPYLIIQVDRYQLPENRIYTNTDSCYWWQDPETGLTDFLFHTPLSQCKEIEPGHFVSPKSEGFSGRTFSFNLSEGRRIDLIGPWSGGSYCANQYLPEKTIEVTFKQSPFSYIAGYLTWRGVEEWLPKGWQIVDTHKYQKHWPELIYNGLTKQDWSKELLQTLQKEYERTK